MGEWCIIGLCDEGSAAREGDMGRLKMICNILSLGCVMWVYGFMAKSGISAKE